MLWAAIARKEVNLCIVMSKYSLKLCGGHYAEWTVKEIPSLAEKLAVVTGANSGIGWHMALELAHRQRGGSDRLDRGERVGGGGSD
jgi:hypothetical protein